MSLTTAQAALVTEIANELNITNADITLNLITKDTAIPNLISGNTSSTIQAFVIFPGITLQA